ncbi:hypothetical protein TTRE_0000225701 [Trichuris trichiura]|uniref:Uncharacterized protein n=1 Tax=Trichuris trichiura TaxID=36087 RepID=A0A077Z2P5_TRITR|nr:hypothetical protein TTRE_0000225701 [Trichuris trichiura]
MLTFPFSFTLRRLLRSGGTLNVTLLESLDDLTISPWLTFVSFECLGLTCMTVGRPSSWRIFLADCTSFEQQLMLPICRSL